MPRAPIVITVGFNGAKDVVLVRAPRGDRRRGRWNPNYAMGIGVTLIVIAIVAFICNIGWLFTGHFLSRVGVGFWAGAMVLATGVLLTLSGCRPSRCLVVSSLIMSLISVLFSAAFIVVGALELAMYPYDDYSLVYNSRSVDPKAMIGFGVLYTVIGIVCFGLLLAASVLGCASLCCSHTTYAARGTAKDAPNGAIYVIY